MALPIGLEQITATIASGTSLSPATGLGAKTLVGIAMPAGWDAASLTFQISIDGGTTWLEMAAFSAGIVASASNFISVDPTYWRGLNNIKVRSGTSGAAVNQTADRVLTLLVRPIA